MVLLYLLMIVFLLKINQRQLKMVFMLLDLLQQEQQI